MDDAAAVQLELESTQQILELRERELQEAKEKVRATCTCVSAECERGCVW